MNITLIVGCTANKKGEKKPERFFGGETEDIDDKQAEKLIEDGFAFKAGSADAKEFLKGYTPNPRTRRQRLDAETPGLREKLAGKAAIAAAMSGAAREAVATAKTAARTRSALME